MKIPLVGNRTVLVTGCSSGIGRAAARLLRDRGWTVYPTARTEADLDRLRAEGFDPVRLDMAGEESVAAAAAEALRRAGSAGLGGVVNNAGFGQPGAVEDVSRAAFRRQFEVNLFGMQDLANRLIPAFRRQGWGRIVNISSVVGRIALPFMGAYSATKFAMEALGDAQRVELHGSGVSVSIVEPGPIETAFGDNAARSGRETLRPEASAFGAVYRAKLERVSTRADRREIFRLPPEAVARAIAHALESPRPRRRYAVTVPAILGAWMARALPGAVLDRILLAYVRDRAADSSR
jgi:NAD(P)-dependent dehydrogenase (short-subunit alcohol dehydrogenase family)